MIPQLTPSEIARFHARVDRGYGCWVWTGQLNNQGYGRFTIYRGSGRLRLLSHRVAYFLAYDVNPIGLVVRHGCDNPLCCRPDHLTTGTQADNIRDAVDRGRINVRGLHQFHADRAERVRERLAAGRRRCPSCGESRPFAEYRRCRAALDDCQGSCRTCRLRRTA